MVYVFTTQWRDTQMKRQFASQLERIVSRHLTRMPLGAIASHTPVEPAQAAQFSHALCVNQASLKACPRPLYAAGPHCRILCPRVTPFNS